jgi:hypothetical protein
MPPDPTPSAASKVTVTVIAAERGAHVIVVGSGFDKLAHGVGEVRIELAPGIYKARFKAGDRLADQLFEVIAEPLVVRGAPLLFSSPIPLARATNTHEYQHGPTQELLRGGAHVRVGDGAVLTLVARDSAHQLGRREDRPPWAGLHVRALDGRDLLVLERDADARPVAGYAGVKASFDPGVYLVSLADRGADDIRFELPVAVCAGWCTQVFVDTHPRARALDLGAAAIVMTRVDGELELDAEMLRLTELARQALTQGEAAVSDAELDTMLEGKLEYPMLGLYAAHTLLCRPEVDWRRIAVIAGHLDRWLVSGHPDVDVLLRACRKHGVGGASRGRRRELFPPMLAASWELALADEDSPAHDSELIRTLGQYRLGGSLWSCLSRPTELPVWREYPPAAKAFEKTSFALGRSVPILRPRVGSVDDRASASEPIAVQANPAEEREARERGWFNDAQSDLDRHARELAARLRRPNPKHTPFQQALCRGLRDMCDENERDARAPDLQNLARQFRLPPMLALQAYHELRVEAEL